MWQPSRTLACKPARSKQSQFPASSAESCFSSAGAFVLTLPVQLARKFCHAAARTRQQPIQEHKIPNVVSEIRCLTLARARSPSQCLEYSEAESLNFGRTPLSTIEVALIMVLHASQHFRKVPPKKGRPTYRTNEHTQTHTHTHTHTHTYRHTDTQTHRHTDTQTHRHTDRQIDRQTDRETERQRDWRAHGRAHETYSCVQPKPQSCLQVTLV